MSDLLKEAIADAKAIRETALQNAKVALEEAFAPRIQSMLSAKLKETDGVDEAGMHYRDDEEEIPGEEVPGDEFEMGAGEVPGDDMGGMGDVPVDVPVAAAPEMGMDMGDEEGMGDEEDVDETVTLNGRTYRLVSEEEIEAEAAQNANAYVESEEGSDDTLDELDLESVIKELENEINEEDEEIEESDNPYDNNEQHNDYKPAGKGTTPSVKKEKFSEGEEEDEEKEEVDEGAAQEDQTALGYDPTGAKRRSVDEPSQGSLGESADNEEDMLEINLEEDEEELEEELKSSGIGKGENKESEQFKADTEDTEHGVVKQKFSEELKSAKTELKEYKEAVKFLKDKLHEVNILNAKLLFTNKLFKEFVLDNSQKMKVVETFDRAQTVREIKLVYSTLAEGFNGNSGVSSRKTLKESAGGSSKSVGSTKPQKKIISEESEVANRFKKLAGLI